MLTSVKINKFGLHSWEKIRWNTDAFALQPGRPGSRRRFGAH